MGFWRGIGEVVNFLGWQTAALRAFETAVRRHPVSALAHYRLGDALARAGFWRRAAQAFSEAARLTPSNPEYHGNLVLALWKSSQPAAALTALDRLAFLQPRAGELRLLQGRLFAKLGQKPQALRALRTASAITPPPSPRRFLLGEALLGAEEWKAALGAWQAASAPLERPRLGLRRRAAKQLGRLKDACLPLAEIETLKGALLFRLGHRQGALRALERAAAAGRLGGGRSPVVEGLLRAGGLRSSRAAVSVLARSAAAKQRQRIRVHYGARPAPASPAQRRVSVVPLATTLAVLGFLALVVQGARAKLALSAGADSPAARTLAEACVGDTGPTSIEACREALELPLSPERTTLVRRSLARKLEAEARSAVAGALTSMAPATPGVRGRP